MRNPERHDRSRDPRDPAFGRWIALCIALILLAGCSSTPRISRQDGVGANLPTPEEIASIPDASPKAEPLSAYGNPESYVVFGKRYRTMKQSRGYSERGIASWYGNKFHGLRTSSGEPYDMYAMTAAHKTLPLPCYARVTNLKNDRSVIVKINDRGPFHDNRLIDLSYTAAWKLGIIGEDTGLVEVSAIDPSAPEPTAIAKPETPKQNRGLPELFLQVGAFGSPGNADRLKQRIEEQLQVSVLIEEIAGRASPVYRVQVGPIASVELADHLSQRLDKLGIRNPHVVIR
jgi:rare lipoprotein A